MANNACNNDTERFCHDRRKSIMIIINQWRPKKIYTQIKEPEYSVRSLWTGMVTALVVPDNIAPWASGRKDQTVR